MRLIRGSNAAPLTRTVEALNRPVTVALVQHQWHPDPDALREELSTGIALAAAEGATVVFLPELTLSRYPGATRSTPDALAAAEDLLTGPTITFARQQAAQHGISIHASLYERIAADSADDDPRGFNTAILVSPAGDLLAKTRKMHIPVTEGYYEDTYFRPGPDHDPYPVHDVARAPGLRLGLPTCWDEWFPEVSRLYSLGGANALAFPTAIGSEPGFPEFDTQPIWQHVIVGNGIMNGLFMIVPNRHGDEGLIQFYGSSFISDPYGRILAQAPRDESAVLVVDLDLEQGRDWLELFPFLATRRPESYAGLVAPPAPGPERPSERGSR